MAARDRLDGTKRKNFLFELYLLPGRLVLWIGYMFPSKGYSRTRGSARHARSPIMTFLYATGIWLFALWFFSSMDLSSVDPAQLEQINSGLEGLIDTVSGSAD